MINYDWARTLGTQYHAEALVAARSGLKISIQIDVNPPDGLTTQALEETKGALRELGLKDELDEK